MSEFLWPWIALALPLPWILRRLLPGARRQLPALRAPFAGELARVAGLDRGVLAPRLLLPALVWGLLCLAAMRPVALGEVVAPPASGRDLLLAVDVSGSMAADDMELGRRRVTRLTAVKAVVADFLDRRVGDRVGLLLFGQRPYLVTPLTFDRGAVRGQLLDSQVGIAGRETAIGDAIGLAVKRLREMPQQQRVLILLTDGVNTAGVLEPRKAAELAAAENVRIYAIGIGSEPGQTRFFGMRIPTQGAEIDEETLTAVAEGTGGRYFRARDTTELAGIYAELDRLEPVADEGEPIRPRIERYVWPLGAALALAGLGVLAGVRRRELAAWH
ncbi:MAG TPA: VWA domain-containing protein [Xanthomonadaceae bacterium]|nr:VWA domain-containing protein [Xanthomonadaceae bacterium]